jgi:hypothetical protein
MDIHEINTNGVYSLKEKNKDFYQMIIGGVLFYALLFIVSKYTIESNGFFIFMIIFLTVLYLLIFIYIPISLKINLNKVVKKIQVSDSKISLTTPNKEYIYTENEIEVIEVKNRFTGFGPKNKDGLLIKTKLHKEYWIVEDFFNNYEELKLDLLSHY